MNLKQIEGVFLNLVAIFAMAALDSVYSLITLGLPTSWPAVRAILGRAALAGAVACFAWIKMRSPWAQNKGPQVPASNDTTGDTTGDKQTVWSFRP